MGELQIATVGAALVLLLATGASAQRADPKESISVTFSVDGKAVACRNLKVQLRFAGRTVVPPISGGNLAVPDVFKRKTAEWGPDEVVDVTVRCDKYQLSFLKMSPSWVTGGLWNFGIEYPPAWIDQFWTNSIEKGFWISCFDLECNFCDPGVLTVVSHSDLPHFLLTRLRREQPRASGERARDIAYALAILGSNYVRNRDHLRGLLDGCLSGTKDTTQEEVCAEKLWLYLTNLYWRGDGSLLRPLLSWVDPGRVVLVQPEMFYADLLARRTADAVNVMHELPAARQESICSLAGGEFAWGSEGFRQVAEQLRAAGDGVADGCLLHLEKTVRRPH